MGLVNVHRKTVERNRKFIIAVSLILRSGLDEIKQFFRASEERREKKNKKEEGHNCYGNRRI